MGHDSFSFSARQAHYLYQTPIWPPINPYIGPIDPFWPPINGFPYRYYPGTPPFVPGPHPYYQQPWVNPFAYPHFGFNFGYRDFDGGFNFGYRMGPGYEGFNFGFDFGGGAFNFGYIEPRFPFF